MKRRNFLLGLAAVAIPVSTAAMQDERVLGTGTVTATFTGWERGDYLWARFQREGSGRRETAMVDDDSIGAFLEAHRARPLRLWIETVRTDLPEAGRTEVRRVVFVRSGGLSAERWWNGLSPRYRRAWLRRYHEAIE
ncbi:MAG TPA: hypothetical protein VLK25_14280 [Allosphingosinicella sp.]|nr:hypothetical protein [Allosphingosinicella sp.]